MTGRTIAHYEILEKLGEGGMGVVYKARDTRLNRFVTLKLLPADKIADEERLRRFTQEARTASGLNHPNIITIHDIASEDGVQFMVMEFVAGKTLDQVIPRKGMRLAEVLKIGAQIAEALTAAAAAGVIHRDIKPGNVMVSDNGHVKVLDFGLAKMSERVVSSEGATATFVGEAENPRTREGTVIGTVSYMSPEQAEGRPLDPRSDIFSFGALLYEMVTGQRAFRGDTSMSTISAILRDDPAPAGQVCADVPRDLEKIIARCLRKDPERRFQTMADVRVSLLELKEESECSCSGQRGTHQGRSEPRVARDVFVDDLSRPAFFPGRICGERIAPLAIPPWQKRPGFGGAPQVMFGRRGTIGTPRNGDPRTPSKRSKSRVCRFGFAASA